MGVVIKYFSLLMLSSLYGGGEASPDADYSSVSSVDSYLW